jgi:hypothetical protein
MHQVRGVLQVIETHSEFINHQKILLCDYLIQLSEEISCVELTREYLVEIMVAINLVIAPFIESFTEDN